MPTRRRRRSDAEHVKTETWPTSVRSAVPVAAVVTVRVVAVLVPGPRVVVPVLFTVPWATLNPAIMSWAGLVAHAGDRSLVCGGDR